MSESKGDVLTVPVANVIKGIAVIMMVIHHCYGFPGWIVEEELIPTIMPKVQAYAFACKFCVPVFAFLTGWAYFFHKDKSCGYSIKKISSCLVEYWVLVMLLMSVAVACCHCAPNLSLLVNELFPFARAHRLMIFAWYIRFYVVTLVLLPFLAVLLDMRGGRFRIAFLVVGMYALYKILMLLGRSDDIYWLPCVLGGYMCAQYGILEKCVNWLSKWNVGWLFGVLAIYVSYRLFKSRECVFSCRISSGALYAPFFCCGWILCYPIIRKLKLDNGLQLLGKHSLNIWLLHGIFFSRLTRGEFQKFAYAVDSPLYVIVFVIGSCLLVSLALKPLQTRIRSYVVERLFS